MLQDKGWDVHELQYGCDLKRHQFYINDIFYCLKHPKCIYTIEFFVLQLGFSLCFWLRKQIDIKTGCMY
jgi:hypothetical protein